MGETKIRTVRVPDDVWQHAQEQARIEGTTVTAYIVKQLRKWKAKP